RRRKARSEAISRLKRSGSGLSQGPTLNHGSGVERGHAITPTRLSQPLSTFHYSMITRQVLREARFVGVRFLTILVTWLVLSSAVFAETPAPSVHWGALSFPDRDRTLDLGLTVNRF